jgi:TonB family protein
MFVLLALAMTVQTADCGERPAAPPVERVMAMRTAADVVSLSRLASGGAVPRDLTLPVLTNGHVITQFLREDYPQGMRGDTLRSTRTMFWVCVDNTGKVHHPTLLLSGGLAVMDSFALEAMQRAQFMPAATKAGRVSVWIPYPVQIAPYAIYRRLPVPDRPETPVFTPYTVKPQLTNKAQIGRALVTNYPPKLRAQGIGGQTLVWLLIDKEGRVERTQLKQTSGYPELDKAALEVAERMQFTPARNHEEPVHVWIQIPIVFKSSN